MELKTYLKPLLKWWWLVIIAAMLARGEVAAKGVHPQELVIPGERMIDELALRGIQTLREQS